MAREMVVTLATGLRLSCAEQGSAGDPALVLLPGPTDSWRSYQPVLDCLPAGVHAIAVSQRGHGDSDKPEAGYRVRDFVADVVRLLDALGIERPVLAGHSGSCLVVRQVAVAHPERVAGLVLEASPTSLRGHPGLERFVREVVEPLEDPISRDLARSFVLDTSSEALGPELLDGLVDELLKVPARVWRGTFAGLLAHDDLTDLGRVSAPALLLWGEADALVPRAMQEELVRRLPQAELRTYVGAGHTPRWDDPERITADIASFTRTVSTRHLPEPGG